MGETQTQPFQLSFKASLKINFQGSRVTSDGGLVLARELDEQPGFGELIEPTLRLGHYFGSSLPSSRHVTKRTWFSSRAWRNSTLVITSKSRSRQALPKSE